MSQLAALQAEKEAAAEGAAALEARLAAAEQDLQSAQAGTAQVCFLLSARQPYQTPAAWSEPHAWASTHST